MRVVLQAGHYPRGGGAPGEAQWTHDLAIRISERLARWGLEAPVVGAWDPHDSRTAPGAARQDAALFVSLHYDGAIYGDGYNFGCFADRHEQESRPDEADGFIEVWEAIYPAETSIPLHNERRNANTRYYYAFGDLTNATPGVLLEHGVGAPVPTGEYPAGEDAHFLHGQIDRVADLDTQAIVAFLGLPPDPPERDVAVLQERIAALEADQAWSHDLRLSMEEALRAAEGKPTRKPVIAVGTVEQLIALANWRHDRE